jgi:hypothetical protein
LGLSLERPILRYGTVEVFDMRLPIFSLKRIALTGAALLAFSATSFASEGPGPVRSCTIAINGSLQAPAPLTAEPISLKKTSLLNAATRELRKLVLAVGSVNTTKLRSEFKHYIFGDDAAQMVARLERDFPPKHDLSGKLISGIESRDNLVRVKPAALEEILGASALTELKNRRVLTALARPEVYHQHQAEVDQVLASLVAPESYESTLQRIHRLHEDTIAKAKNRKRSTYTDTTSSGKISYDSGLSEKAIEESLNLFGLKTTSIPKSLTKIQDTDLFDAPYDIVTGLFDSLVAEGVDRDLARSFLRDLGERAADEGVMRLRKYREGEENVSFNGVPGPGSGLKSTNPNIRDAAFADGITWLEFKMKRTLGETARKTVVDKPRFPLSDALANMIEDPSHFLSDAAFEKTRTILKADIQTNFKKLNAISDWNEAEVEAGLNFIRGLHKQGISLKPVGRTVYMRDSHNLNLVDSDGRIHNIQLTFDRYVWELDRTTGALLQALPWVEKNNGWHFQYDAPSGWFVHRDAKSGKPLHAMHPHKPGEIFDVSNGSGVMLSGPFNVQPVLVGELKVPVQFIELSPELIASFPALAAVLEIRKQMIADTGRLNESRVANGLKPFAVDRGKRSTSRKDLAGGIKLKIHPLGLNTSIAASKMIEMEFNFNPETGYWVHWNEDVAIVYHPSVGVMKVTPVPGRPNEVRLTPIYFINEQAVATTERAG